MHLEEYDRIINQEFTEEFLLREKGGKMKILIGTTNPSKIKRFEKMLAGYDVTFCTLKDLNITQEPEESGNTPEENAILKAKFYGQYYDYVICND